MTDNHSLEDGQPILEQNTSDEYIRTREWRSQIRHDKTCKGRLHNVILTIWEILHSLEPLWQIIIISGVATGVQFAATLARQDVERALVSGLFSGILAGIILLLLWKVSFQYGAFVDRETARHFRNEFHPSTIVSYILLLVIAVLVAVFIYSVDRNCSRLVNEPCDLKHVFIGK